jgi:hypothetical protein
MGPATLSRYLALPLPLPLRSPKSELRHLAHARATLSSLVDAMPERHAVWVPGRPFSRPQTVLMTTRGGRPAAHRSVPSANRLPRVFSVSLLGASASANVRACSPLCHVAMRAPKANELMSVSYVAASSLTHYRYRRHGSTIFVCAAAKESLFWCCSLCLCAGPVGRAVGHG